MSILSGSVRNHIGHWGVPRMICNGSFAQTYIFYYKPHCNPPEIQNFLGAKGAENMIFERFSSFKTLIFFGLRPKICVAKQGGIQWLGLVL